MRAASPSRFPVWAGWSPFGTHFAYLENGWGECSAIYVGIPDEQRISDTALIGGAFSWSPDRVEWVE